MSQYSHPVPRPAAENTLGLAGFICSLVGLVGTAGLLCPVGLLISLIALGRQPKGFAIAGVIIGLIGSCGWLIAAVVFGSVLLLALGLAGVSLLQVDQNKISDDMIAIAVAIKSYEKENEYLPAGLELLDVDADRLIDPWGNAYEYRLVSEDSDVEAGFDLISWGKDGRLGTLDDLHLSEMGDTWKAGSFNMKVDGQDDGGRVKVTLFGKSLVAEGDDEGGRVEIDFGDHVIEIVGDEKGGRVSITPESEADEGSSHDEGEAGDGPEDDDRP